MAITSVAARVDTEQHLYVSSVPGEYAWGTPGTAFEGTDDIELVIRLRSSDWTPLNKMYLLSKWQDTGSNEQLSFLWTVESDGRLKLTWRESDDTEQSVTSTSPLGYGANTMWTLKAGLVLSTGAVTFSERRNDDASWSNIAAGSAVGATSVNASTTVPLRIGNGGGAIGWNPLDEVAYVEMWRGGVRLTYPKFFDPLQWTVGEKVNADQHGRTWNLANPADVNVEETWRAMTNIPPWEVGWDTTEHPDGSYNLLVKVITDDPAEDTDTVTVTIDNVAGGASGTLSVSGGGSLSMSGVPAKIGTLTVSGGGNLATSGGVGVRYVLLIPG